MSQREFVHQLPGSGLADNRRRSIMGILHLDPWLTLLLLLILCAGMVVLYSAADGQMELVQRQASRAAIALLVMLGIAQLDPVTLRRWSPWIFLAGLCGLVAVLWVGVGAKGAQRWLAIPGLPQFQPSELMKLAAPMAVAWYLARQVLPPRLPQVMMALFLCLLAPALIVRQPDLGTALLVAGASFSVLFLAGISWKLLLGFGALVAMAAPLLWFFVMLDYQKQRVLTLLNPESDPLGAGWNIIQSKTAIGSGGMTGKGWMQGTQSHLDFIPESHTDFIVAVLAEEFGLVGVLVILLLYLLVVVRGLFIATQAQDSFGRLLAGSVTLTFFIYVFVNMGMVSGILPVVGVPLPLVSYGGTSIVSLMAGFGLLMSIHTHRRIISA